MEKRKVRKVNKTGKSMILFVLLFISISLTVSSIKEVVQTFTLKASISEALERQEELQKKKEELQKEKTNLENPEYLLRYARGKYLVTKDDGEQVFKLPEEKEE